MQTEFSPARLLLADDHPVLRDGLKVLLREKGFQIVGEAANGLEAVKLSAKTKPDVAILDISMPLMNGIDAGAEIQRVSPATKIVLLTVYPENRYVIAGLRAGVSAYVLKSKSASNIFLAIEAARKGEVYLCPGISRNIITAFLSHSELKCDPLSPRERSVLQLIAEGKNVKEIGDLLGISAKTAETHRSNIMYKLQIHDVASLVRYAIREGLVTLE